MVAGEQVQPIRPGQKGSAKRHDTGTMCLQNKTGNIKEQQSKPPAAAGQTRTAVRAFPQETTS